MPCALQALGAMPRAAETCRKRGTSARSRAHLRLESKLSSIFITPSALPVQMWHASCIAGMCWNCCRFWQKRCRVPACAWMKG